jgi:hypothetical protein
MLHTEGNIAEHDFVLTSMSLVDGSVLGSADCTRLSACSIGVSHVRTARSCALQQGYPFLNIPCGLDAAAAGDRLVHS